MTYFRDRYQGVGAIAAEADAPRSAPAPTISSIPTITSRTKLMLAVPQPMTVGRPVMITPGVKVVRMAPTPQNIIVRVPRAPAPSIETLREAKLFAGTPAAATGPDLQIGTGIGAPNPSQPDPSEIETDQVLLENASIATPIQTTQIQTAPAPITISDPIRPTPPFMAPVPAPPSSSSCKWPWLVGGGILAYLLLKD